MKTPKEVPLIPENSEKSFDFFATWYWRGLFFFYQAFYLYCWFRAIRWLVLACL